MKATRVDGAYHCAILKDGEYCLLCGEAKDGPISFFDNPTIFMKRRFDASQVYDGVSHTCPKCQTHPDLPLLVLGEYD